jgi:hypothetical protein
VPARQQRYLSPNLLPVARLEDVRVETPTHAEADGIDLVIVRRGPDVNVFEGRCPHRGALLARCSATRRWARSARSSSPPLAGVADLLV